MKSGPVLGVVVLCGASLAASSQAGARVPSATLEVVRKIVPAVLVSVTNKYTRPVVAIQVSALHTNAGFRFSDHRSGAAPVPNATILVGETRTLVVRVESPSSSAAVTAALFEDGHGEGELTTLRQLAQMGPSGPSATPPTAAATFDTPVRSVVATSRAGTATDIMLRLTNQREAPIRAWRIDEYETQSSGRVTTRGGQATSLCDNASPGLIRSREVREIFWSGAENYTNGNLPTLAVSAVLWEDGVTEGSAPAVDELQGLRARSRCR